MINVYTMDTIDTLNQEIFYITMRKYFLGKKNLVFSFRANPKMIKERD